LCRCLYCNLTFILSGMYLEVDFLDHMAVLFLVFWGASILFSMLVVLIYISPNTVWGFLFPFVLTNICCSWQSMYTCIIYQIAASPPFFIFLPNSPYYGNNNHSNRDEGRTLTWFWFGNSYDAPQLILIFSGIYSVIKKNEILSFAGKWMELKNIIISEVNQVQKTKGHMFSLICGR
jgi:hypothetical protein